MPDLAITAAGSLAAADAPARLRQAARAFEEQFAAQLLRPMAERSPEDEELFGRDAGGDTYRSLFANGLAEHAAGGLGVAAIVEQAMAERLRSARP